MCLPIHKIDPLNLVYFQPSSTQPHVQCAQTKDEPKYSLKKKNKHIYLCHSELTQGALLRGAHRCGQCNCLHSLVNNKNQNCQEIHNSALAKLTDFTLNS